MRPKKSWPKDLLWACGGSEDFLYQMTEFNAMWLECQKECYFALKEEVLLTVITGTPKKRLRICTDYTSVSYISGFCPQKVGGSHIHRHSHILILLWFCKNVIFLFQRIPQKGILSFVELHCATWFQALLVWVWVSVWRLLKSVKQDQDGGGLTQRTQYCRH